MEKLWKKCASKASPRPFLILVNNPKQPLNERNYFKEFVGLRMQNFHGVVFI